MIDKNLIFLFLTAILNPAYSQGILYYDNSISVYEFNQKLADPWGGGINAGQFGMIDFTGDGIQDLVVYDRSSNMLNTFRYESGEFLFSPEYRSFFPEDLTGYVLFRDYDADGFIDIFTDGERGMKAYHNITTQEFPDFEVAADPINTLTNSGLINMQVNFTDIPDIDDLDGDGDLDVLVYNFAIGRSIRHHKNLSIEKYGNPDSLDFELINREWGQFQECECHQFAFVSLGETCESLAGGRAMHVGGKSLLTIDMDGDGDRDYLGGHENCNELYFFPNTGNPDSALMTSFSEYFPDSTERANFPVFPSGFWDDFDHDGVKDLIVSPNSQTNYFRNIDYDHSVWLYKNSGQNDFPDFHLISRDFLQEGMIDAGENAVPALADFDRDGDLDLFVAGNGMPDSMIYYGHVILYENTGSEAWPEFALTDEDYLNLSSLKIFDPFIAFADFNHNGSNDLFISGTGSGGSTVISRILYNKSARDDVFHFDPGEAEIIDLPFSIKDTPCFTDVNEDGLVDMLLGKYTGRLDFFRNIGSESTPFFLLEEHDFLGIRDSYVEFRHNLVPWTGDIDLDGNDDLLTGDYQGDIFVYYNFKNHSNRKQIFFYNSVLERDESWKQGNQTWIAGGKLFKNQFPSLIFGNNQGGITLFRQELPGLPNAGLDISIFPNPISSGQSINLLSSQSGEAAIYSINGRILFHSIPITANREKQVTLHYFPAGIYVVKMTDLRGISRAAKFIVKY